MNRKGHQGTAASGPDSHGSPPMQKHQVYLPSGSEAEVTASEQENGNTCCLHCTTKITTEAVLNTRASLLSGAITNHHKNINPLLKSHEKKMKLDFQNLQDLLKNCFNFYICVCVLLGPGDRFCFYLWNQHC